MLQSLTQAVKDGVSGLFSEVGLTDSTLKPRSTLEKVFLAPNRGKSWLPEGNELEIPKGVSPKEAHRAVVEAMRRRSWAVTTEMDDKIVATLVEKKRVATETATISADKITIIPEQFDIGEDGQKHAREPHLRWHRNLKETIWEGLLLLPVESAPAAE